MRETLTLPPGSAAVLLIDLQEEQRTDPAYFAAGFTQVLARAADVLEAARQGGWPVAHARYVRDFASVPPRPFEVTTAGGGPAFSDPAGGQTAGCPEVAPVGDEPVFTKNDASAFDGTGLGDWLGARGVTWIAVCGVWTEACVAATIRDGIAAGYRMLMVKDACGSGTGFMHETATLDLANRLYGGGICDAARMVRLIQGGAASVWRIGDPVPFRYGPGNVSRLYEDL